MNSSDRDRNTHRRPDGPQDWDVPAPSAAQDPEIHIASFIVQHRDSAADALAAWIAGHADLELALSGPARSIVICESADRHAVMQRVDALQALPGVLNVLLVYHHAEPAQALAEPLSSSLTSANGAPP
ncbi:chaperone NapD [Tahibacter caeni]|uniref:chaperone NapD n=1 Tax=Tahibacter caeni TaxID=1453545 RepID=UPI00214792E0|nr:chaperone NapD [Tahibacter caeni]